MTIDANTVRRVARLARLKISDSEAETLQDELSSILGWIEQLEEVDVEGVEPMTSVVETQMRLRSDEISDGNYPDKIVSNASLSEDNFFMVPKVVE